MKRVQLTVIVLLFALLGGAFAARPVFAQESGNVCVQDYLAGAVCTAEDVRIEEIEVLNVVKACDVAPVGTTTVEFRALVSAEGSPNRYDIGIFVDQSGASQGALSGDNCYHDYLAPPITESYTLGDYNGDGVQDIVNGPWADLEPDPLDTCGDMPTDTQVFKTFTLTLPCVDNSGDPLGAADVQFCASWDNNRQNTCTGVTTAVPGTNSKCGCYTMEFNFTPNAVEMANEPSSNNTPLFIAVGAASLAVVGGFFVLRHKARNEA